MMTFRFATAGLLACAVGLSTITVAEADWWNPFRSDPPPPPAPAVQQPPPQPPQPIGQPAFPQQGQMAPVPAAADPGDVVVRIERIENQMRAMTGQIEQLTYQLRQLQQELQALEVHTDFPAAKAEVDQGRRSEALDRNSLAGAAAMREVPMEGVVAQPADPGAQAGIRRGEPPRDLGTLPVEALPANGPIDLSALAGGQHRQAVAVAAPAGGSPRQAYEQAYQLILTGDYELAESQFRGFLANYPGDTLAADAQYWLGESLYTRGLYREAADEFLSGYRSYPKSGKAPDTLLKLGMSLEGLGQREAACATYAEVLKKYPDASNAMVQRVRSEQSGASC